MKILSRPKGNAEEYGRWGVNPYVGCPHNCSYCYLKKGVWKNTLGGSVPTLKKKARYVKVDFITEGYIDGESAAPQIARKEINKHRDEIIRDGGLFMTFTSDPCLNETRKVFFQIAAFCVLDKVPVMILTKRGDFTATLDYRQLILPYLWLGGNKLLSFGWTLTGHDELEPNASTNEQRIAEMAKVHADGFKTWASIEPVIDFESSLDMIKQALDAGCQHFKIGLLTNNTRVCRDKYDLQQCLSFIGYVMQATADRATVYWKQSVRDFIGPDLEWHLDIDGHSVGKNYNIFNNQ